MRDHIFGGIDALAAADGADGLHRSSRCWPIRSGSTAGSAPTPISSTCSTSARSPCRRRCTPHGTPFGITLLAQAGNDARWPRSAACSMPTPVCRSARPASRSRRSRRSPACPPPARSRSRWSARISPACRSTASSNPSARGSWSGHDRARTIACFCCPAPRRRSPGCCGSPPATAAPIDVEIWAMPAEQFGRFVAVDPGAAVDRHADGSADGRSVKGFLVEAEATRDARDISAFGGWRSFMEQMKVSA